MLLWLPLNPPLPLWILISDNKYVSALPNECFTHTPTRRLALLPSPRTCIERSPRCSNEVWTVLRHQCLSCSNSSQESYADQNQRALRRVYAKSVNVHSMVKRALRRVYAKSVNVHSMVKRALRRVYAKSVNVHSMISAAFFTSYLHSTSSKAFKQSLDSS